ncbi:MAG: hypothetical protein EB075_11255 [Bacteroidetes bacterium]|nr:hypothetical protein [Bacteroidota bacterium]
MANVKITDLGAYTDPVSTDVLPIVDVGADVTKKVSIADLLKNASAGTAAAPGFAFDGDNTGIYSPGADQLAISTGGSGRFFVDEDGNVSIGTASPVALLHVEGNSDDTSAGSTALLRVESIGTGTDAGIRLKSGGSTYSQIGSIGGEVYAYANGAERVRITTAGRLGVGTSTPGDRLELAGAGNGIILASPDGTRYRLTVANGGTLSIAAV